MSVCVPGGGLHNHFQLSCIFDDLLCQLRRGDGYLFCPLLLTGERVLAVWAQTPSSLRRNTQEALAVQKLNSMSERI